MRIDGQFTHLKARAACKTPAGVPLAEASASGPVRIQPGGRHARRFLDPALRATVNIAGWHLHFVNDARSGGGHLFDCQASALDVQLQELSDLRIAMPETAAFLQADLTRDPTKDLNAIERGKGA